MDAKNNWKRELKFCHYDIEREKLMLIWQVMRALDQAGIEDEHVSEFLSKEEKRLSECLATKDLV